MPTTLTAEIDEPVAVEQRATVFGKRLAVAPEERLHGLLGRICDHFVWMEQRRRIVMDAGFSAVDFDEFGKDQLVAAVRGGLGDSLLDHRLPVRRQHRQEIRFVQARVPDLQNVHLGEVFHVRAIAVGARDGGVTSVAVAQPIGSRGQHEGSGEALDVPFPGRRQRLVQIVDVEQQSAFGSREPAEIEQMRVAANLDMDAGGRRLGKVGRHHPRRSAIERERRL